MPLRLFACLVALLVLGPALHGQSEPASLSQDLVDLLATNSQQTVRVIVSGDPEQSRAAGRRVGARELRVLSQSVVLELSPAQLRQLAREGVRNLSGDLPVAAAMLVTNPTIGADQVWAGWGGGLLGLSSYPGVNGQGIGVAVLDSGVAATHKALKSQIAASVDLISTATGTNDEFGHGTHVAGIIAGWASGTAATPLFKTGVAPGARLINVRVLGADGSGLTSDVIAGIDWVIANRSRYNIRVINLSLGHSVTEPSSTDPLCQAVARAVNAGIVVVASAGNSGRTPAGRTVLGGISSPGNSPFAITVGALSTQGTPKRADDKVAAYSSRGPTRFEFALKPDIVAPGTRIVAPEAFNSWIIATYPTLHAGGAGDNAYMTLSGTSMSAAVVSGGVALLLQAKPNLTPAQVKLALQATATFMPGAGLIGGGAGSVNLLAARQTVSDGLVTGLVTTIGGVLTPSSGMTFWDGGTLIRRVYDGPGRRLLGLLELPLVWSNTDLLHWGDLNLVGSSNPLASTAPNYIIWGEVGGWTSSYYIIWGETIVTPQSDYIIWGESGYIIWGESNGGYILWGESTLAPEAQ
jgi:serine protease AprX